MRNDVWSKQGNTLQTNGATDRKTICPVCHKSVPKKGCIHMADEVLAIWKPKVVNREYNSSLMSLMAQPIIKLRADDIVTRLRDWGEIAQIRICKEAADEIERLRNLGDALAHAIDKLDGFYSPDEDVVLHVERTLDAWKEQRRA